MPPAASSTAAAYVQSNVGASTSATATAATVTNADGGSSTSELSRHSHSVAQQAHQGSSNSNNKALVGSRRGTRSSRRRSVSDHIRNSKGVPVYTDADHPLAPARLAARGYHSFSCLGVPFYVNRRYRFIRELGIGAYGCVALARDLVLDCNVAIKKVTRVFERDVLARRALREVAILRHLSLCDNATVLLDFDASFVQFGEIYFVLSASEADLSQIIRSGQQLSDAHLQYFTAQILRGVRYMHSARIIHRDLKPGNLLVNADCALRLCASPKLKVRTTRLDFPGGPLTEYVATRWYRAPEIMLCFKEGYGPEIDMWSVGCILAELIGGRPIFAGKDYVDQIARINNVLGTPAPETIAKIGSARAKTYVQSLPQMPKVPFENLYPKASPEALDLLGRMLTWDPHERISAEDALQHPWLKAYHESNARWLPPEPFERFEDVEMISSFKQFQDAIVREADEMRAELAALDVE
ncbi:Pkinase-domain-containing protein, partial [Tilletiaria anomala UBC 951]